MSAEQFDARAAVDDDRVHAPSSESGQSRSRPWVTIAREHSFDITSGSSAADEGGDLTDTEPKAPQVEGSSTPQRLGRHTVRPLSARPRVSVGQTHQFTREGWPPGRPEHSAPGWEDDSAGCRSTDSPRFDPPFEANIISRYQLA